MTVIVRKEEIRIRLQSSPTQDRDSLEELQEGLTNAILELVCMLTSVSKQHGDLSSLTVQDTVYTIAGIALGRLPSLTKQTQLYTAALAKNETDFHISFI